MTSRRDVIQLLSAALAATPAIAVAATPAVSRRDTAVHRVLVDLRFPESRAFAEPFAQRGVKVAAFKGDLTEVWLHDLGPLWKAGPAAITGVTGPDALFVLEHLARGAGLKVLTRSTAGPKSAAVAWLIA